VATSALPTTKELRTTSVVRFPLTEASAKVRVGGPIDEPDDLDCPFARTVIRPSK
jgi:hypothetical protein